MKIKNNFLAIVLGSLTLISCGGGVGGSGGTIDDTIVVESNQKSAKGKISSIDSEEETVVVNGLTFRHTNAKIKRNSATANKETLKIGQTILAKGKDSNNDGIYDAEELQIDDQLLGPISAIDSINNSITILEQLIYIKDTTRFEGKKFANLEIGDYCSVFGYQKSTGSVDAVLVEFLKDEFLSGQDYVYLEGKISSINLETNIVVVNGVEVQLDHDEIKGLEVGEFFTLDEYDFDPSISSTISAPDRPQTPDGQTNNNQTDDVNSNSDKFVENDILILEGTPDRIENESGTFYIDNIQVKISDKNIERILNSLMVDNHIVIEGRFNDKGILLIDDFNNEEKEIEFELQGLLKPTDIKGIFTILGQKVIVNEFTITEVNLSKIPERLLFVTGFVNENNHKVATHIYFPERDDHLIEGKVTSKGESSLFVSDIKIEIKDSVYYENKSATLSTADLMRAIEINQNIRVIGVYSENGNFTAEKITNLSIESNQHNETSNNNNVDNTKRRNDL